MENIYQSDAGDIIGRQVQILNSLTEGERANIKEWSKNASIHSLDGTLDKFKNIVQETNVLGAKIQYTDYLDGDKVKVVTIPKNLDDLDLRHLYMIARSDALATLDKKKQNELTMLLVMETCISITTYATQYGGLGGNTTQLNPHAKTILINQAGIDFGNQAQHRFLQDSSDKLQITASDGVKISRTKYKDFIKAQFELALKATDFQGKNLASGFNGEYFDFRFLRAGMGIFAGKFEDVLDVPRLEAIEEYLKEKILNGVRSVKRLDSISLPFEEMDIQGVQKKIDDIKKSFKGRPIDVFFEKEDCLKPRHKTKSSNKHIVATTDTSNPLWRFKGGGVFGMINNNALGIHRDVFLNPDILVNGTQLDQIERNELNKDCIVINHSKEQHSGSKERVKNDEKPIIAIAENNETPNHNPLGKRKKHVDFNDNTKVETFDADTDEHSEQTEGSETLKTQNKKPCKWKSIVPSCLIGCGLAIATGFLVEKPLKNAINNKALLYLSIASIALAVGIISGFVTKFIVDKVSQCNSSENHQDR